MNTAIATLAAIAQETRLRVLQTLLAHEPDGLPAGALASALSVPANTLSVHLAQLSAVNLVTRERRGRWIIYRARPETLGSVLRFVARDCCNGHPEVCLPLLSAEDACAAATCSPSMIEPSRDPT